ncbi:MAG TPA: hypothetical protein VF795_02585 [Desulfuromonadaceae bacterium]
MKKRIMIILAIPLIVSILYACANTTSVVKMHPEKVTGMPDCTECHNDIWATFNHQSTSFFAKHRFYAQQQPLACATCHEESFCVDCHAHKEEIKPSDKYADSPERNLPHRGDYLSQHMIDGRVNPAPCARCHGRQNNEGCKACHR